MKKIIQFCDKYSFRIYLIFYAIFYPSILIWEWFFLLNYIPKEIHIHYIFFIEYAIFLIYHLFEYKHKIGYYRRTTK